MEYVCSTITYASINDGIIEVYVADIEDDMDEKAILDQMTAIQMGWTDQ